MSASGRYQPELKRQLAPSHHHSEKYGIALLYLRPPTPHLEDAGIADLPPTCGVCLPKIPLALTSPSLMWPSMLSTNEKGIT